MVNQQRRDLLGTEDKDGINSQPIGESGTGTNADHEEVRLIEPVELDRSDDHFIDNAYEMYAELRAKGPVSRARFVGAEDRRGEERREIFRPSTFFVTHYDEVIETLLDNRFSVDPHSGISEEELAQ